jgi:hypothetical protein
MYFDNEKDRIRTMITGAPLSAEDIMARDSAIGSDYGGTSWFFTMHLIAKSLTRKNETTISFDSLSTTINNYQIHDWNNEYKLKRIESKWISVFNEFGLGNLHLDSDKNIVIDGSISKKEFRNFADQQYAYALKNGLVTWNQYDGWHSRERTQFIERILWHYTTSIYDGPKVIADSIEGNYLEGLFTNFTEKMENANLSCRGIPIWTKNDVIHGLDFLQGWERSFIAKNVFAQVDIGDTLYIAPRFFSEIDDNILADSDSTKIVELIENVRRVPGYPVSKGNTVLRELAYTLQRAGAIKLIEDPVTTSKKAPYMYLVSKDTFEYVDKQLNYNYSNSAFNECKEGSITDQFFVALGRTNLCGREMAPVFRIASNDYKYQVDQVITDLEEKHHADVSNIPPELLEPLKTINVISQDGTNLVVNPENSLFITKFSDFWNELFNYPELHSIDIPSLDIAAQKEKEQITKQINKSADRFFS